MNIWLHKLKNLLFYFMKPAIPRRMQIFIRRVLIKNKRRRFSHIWPVDPAAGKKPEGFTGWPDNKQFALILNHDVDTHIGHDNCYNLMNLEIELGFRSTFFFVPERYSVSMQLINDLKKNGFGVGVHGLKHDGKLFKNRKRFLKQAQRINTYLKAWDTRGFSSPSMHRNFDWMYALDIDYATSSFDTDPFEPQPQGVSTVFPFIIRGNNNHQYVELPYTLAQDFTIFVLMQEKNTYLWKTKLQWIAHQGAMAFLNTHPDYMCFTNTKPGNEQYKFQQYKDFLMFVKDSYSNKYWHVLSREIAVFWNSLKEIKQRME